LLGACRETDCAASNNFVGFWHAHSDGASDDGVRARQVHFGPEVNITLADVAELAGSFLIVLLLVIASRAMLTDVGVEDGSDGVASISQIAQRVNSNVGIIGALDAAPDLGAVFAGTLRHPEESSDISLLVGVIEDALGSDSLIVPVVWV